MRGRRWPPGSVVFYCGNTVETWGPDTLDRGMGGSEEAVVYLSRALAERGYDVTVFNARAAPAVDRGVGPGAGSVVYRPNTELDRADRFHVFVAWRAADGLRGVRARVRLVDLHDPELVARAAWRADLFMVKSQYHRRVCGRVPARKFVVVGNGVVPEQFVPTEKEPFSVGYFSSYHRGLLCLLRMWPAIRARAPEATLRVHYGWDVLDAHVPYVPELADLKAEILARLAELGDHGVVECGRVSHEELARVMGRTQVWAYPTEFGEIHCLTALKAQQAGAWPVTTNVGALAETVRSGDRVECADIYTNAAQQAVFVDKVVDALRHPRRSPPVPGSSWSDVAEVWDAAIRRCLEHKGRLSPSRLLPRVGDAWLTLRGSGPPARRWAARAYGQLARNRLRRSRR